MLLLWVFLIIAHYFKNPKKTTQLLDNVNQ